MGDSRLFGCIFERTRIGVLGTFIFLAVFNAWADSNQRSVDFEIAVVPEIARHADLLAYPPYLALALENNGVSPSLSSRIVLLDKSGFQIKAGAVRFKQRTGEAYAYEALVSLPPAGMDAKLSLTFEVDTRRVAQGTLTVRVFTPLAGLMPNDLRERISQKIGSLAGMPTQRKLVAYLDKLKAQQPADMVIQGVLETILIESYNRAGAVAELRPKGVDRGAAEPLPDQWFFLLTMLIWLVATPALLLYVRKRRLISASK